jgi:hypothetical protein
VKKNIGQDISCPVKRRQALLGSNLPRDSRVQVALNNAHNDRGGVVLIAAPSRVLSYSRLPAHALKKPNIIGCAQRFFIFFNPSAKLTSIPSFYESALR